MSDFTRRHYQFIANVLRKVRSEYDPTDKHVAGVDHVAEELAEQFREDNPRFNEEQFLDAAGVGDDEGSPETVTLDDDELDDDWDEDDAE